MDGFTENALRLVLLSVPILMGVLAGSLRLIPEDPRAGAALNTFALYFGFPALIVSGMLDARFELPTSPGFWIAVPLVDLGLMLAVRAITGTLSLESQAGTVALVALFGNVAFLGLPFVVEVFGEGARGLAALAVSIHVACAVGFGPVVLRRWSGPEGASASATSVLRQPLLWAPFVGLGARSLGPGWRDAMQSVVAPTGAAAAPVALFLLGLYLYAERRTLVEAERGTAVHLWVRMALAPAWTLCVVLALSRLGWMTREQAAIFVVLAGMPAAVTTFSMAHDAQVGSRRVAAAVVRSSAASLVTLPILATIVRWF